MIYIYIIYAISPALSRVRKHIFFYISEIVDHHRLSCLYKFLSLQHFLVIFSVSSYLNLIVFWFVFFCFFLCVLNFDRLNLFCWCIMKTFACNFFYLVLLVFILTKVFSFCHSIIYPSLIY